MQQLSRWFTQGALVLLPVIVTVLILAWIVQAIEALTPFVTLPTWLKVILALAAVVVIGWLASFWGTRWLVHYGEAILARIPLVRTIYGSVKQMSEALADPQKFLGRPVLVPFGGEESLFLGFFVGEVRVPHDEEPWGCVFLPMSLNVTGGFNVFVPLEMMVPVPDVDREEAFRFILTAGASMPKEWKVAPKGE